jgi:hypothetical protein
MKTAIATVIFGLFSMQSAQAADCYSYSDYESVNNNIAACYGIPAAQEAETVATVQGAFMSASSQSSYLSGNEYAAAA